jgi:hypothetical protein
MVQPKKGGREMTPQAKEHAVKISRPIRELIRQLGLSAIVGKERKKILRKYKAFSYNEHIKIESISKPLTS